ncbi:MAG: DMT family transporter [Alphaproteobacteria bacterium]
MPFTFALLAIGLAAVAHGAIFARLAEADPILISAARTGIGALVLLPAGLATGWAAMRAGGLAALGRSFVGGAFLAAHFAAWIASLDHTSIANSVVLVALSPIWLSLWAVLVRGEPVTRAMVLSVGLSVAGSAVIGFAGAEGAAGETGLLGDGLALAGGVFVAGYFLAGQRAMVTAPDRRLPLLAYLGQCYAIAALLLWAAVLILDLQVAGLGQTTYLAMAGAGVVSQVIGHSTYNWALGRFSPRFVAVCLLGEPILTTLLGLAYFGEAVPALAVLGGAMVLVAIYVGAMAERRPEPAPS